MDCILNFEITATFFNKDFLPEVYGFFSSSKYKI